MIGTIIGCLVATLLGWVHATHNVKSGDREEGAGVLAGAFIVFVVAAVIELVRWLP